MESQNFCLKWDSFQSAVTSAFDKLRLDEELVDVTLCCEGETIEAHRIILSACSPYFRDVLKGKRYQHLVIFMQDTLAVDLRALVEFMYKGRVNVLQTQLASFLKTAESLQIRGLTGDEDNGPPPPLQKRPLPAESTPVAVRSHHPINHQQLKRRDDSTPTPADIHRLYSPFSQATAHDDSVLAASGALSLTHSRASSTPASAPKRRRTASPAGGGNESDGQQLPSLAAGGHSRLVSPPQQPLVKQEKLEVVLDDDGDDTAKADIGDSSCMDLVDETEDVYLEQDASAAITGFHIDDMYHDGSMPGPSQLSVGLDEASIQEAVDYPFECETCGRRYKHRGSLCHHRHIHEGRTVCPMCGKVCSIIADLRRHLGRAHALSAQQIFQLVPTRCRNSTNNYSNSGEDAGSRTAQSQLRPN